QRPAHPILRFSSGCCARAESPTGRRRWRRRRWRSRCRRCPTGSQSASTSWIAEPTLRRTAAGASAPSPAVARRIVVVDQQQSLSPSSVADATRGVRDRLSGLFGPVVTTFRSDETLDLDAFASNLRAHLAAGMDGILVTGSTGEAALVDEG